MWVPVVKMKLGLEALLKTKLGVDGRRRGLGVDDRRRGLGVWKTLLGSRGVGLRLEHEAIP